jgi:electron transfer flavoprotein alpha subunit
MKVLVIAEHDGSKLSDATARTVTCANAIPGASVTVAVLAADPQAVASQAAALNGVADVLTVAHADLSHPVAAIWASTVETLAAGFTHLLMGSTALGKELLPRVAARLGVAQISDCMEVLGAHRFKRPTYAANALVTLDCPADKLVVATVRLASFEAAGSGGSAAIHASAVAVKNPGHTRYGQLATVQSDRPDLTSAKRVVSGGRALASRDNFELIYGLAKTMNAAVGASRAAVDAGYAPNELQVGQTGKIIAPDVYLAIGISGAIQHLTGIKDAKTIVAINKDPEAPIFEVADLGLVGDLFEIVQQLKAELGG